MFQVANQTVKQSVKLTIVEDVMLNGLMDKDFLSNVRRKLKAWKLKEVFSFFFVTDFPFPFRFFVLVLFVSACAYVGSKDLNSSSDHQLLLWLVI